MNKNIKTLIKFILIPIALGSLVGILTVPNSNIDSIIPSWVFPVVWTILYTLMGISAYLIYRQENAVPQIYTIQLIFNLLWSFVFFEFKLFTLAFIWILFLIILVIIMIVQFYKINKTAGLLQIPYLIWLFVAAYLNFTFL